MRLFALLPACLLLAACSASFGPDPSRPGLPPRSLGVLPNPYAEDRSLAAVAISMRAPGPFSRNGGRFILQGVESVSYAFWDGRVRQVLYWDNGAVKDAFWWPLNARLRQGSAGWSGFDFAYGSDPTFLRHRDPRLPPVAPGNG